MKFEMFCVESRLHRVLADGMSTSMFFSVWTLERLDPF